MGYLAECDLHDQWKDVLYTKTASLEIMLGFGLHHGICNTEKATAVRNWDPPLKIDQAAWFPPLCLFWSISSFINILDSIVSIVVSILVHPSVFVVPHK